MRIEEKIIGEAAVDAAAAGLTVEEVLAGMVASMDAEAAQRGAATAEGERMQARARERQAPAQPMAAPLTPPRPSLPADRGAAIDALLLPGTEFMGSALKADSSITIEAASQRILAEYKRQRGLGVAVTSSPVAAVPQTAAGWAAEWEGSKALQADHGSAAAYANYMQGVADGRIRVLAPSPGIIRSGPVRR